MFLKLLFTAVLAGFGAGLAASVLHFGFAQPLLLHGEMYEMGELTHPGAAMPDLPSVLEDWQRNGMTVLFMVLIYAGYALLLTGAMALAERQGHQPTIRSGIIFGVAGWVVVHLAPASGMPPELPGASAAYIDDRQIWWYATVLATSVGLWLIAFGRRLPLTGLAVVLLLGPHIAGAPQPESFYSPAPPELAAHFAAVVLATGLASWAILGALVGHFWQAGED